MSFRFACLLLSFALLCPALAAAESRPTLLADYVGPARSGAFELDLGWFTDSSDSSTLHALVPSLSARVAVADQFDLELDWPFAFVTTSSDFGDGVDEFRSGNPFLAGYYVSRLSDGYLRAGFGFAPPLASADELSAVPLTLAVAMRGFWDVWLYLPEHLSLVVPFQLESRKRALLLGLDTALAVHIPTGEFGDETDVSLQLAGSVGGKTDVLSAGLRLQLVWIPTSGGDTDNAQVAMVPFVQADFPTGVFLYLRVLVDLDEPYGVFGDGLDFWAIWVGGGGRF